MLPVVAILTGIFWLISLKVLKISSLASLIGLSIMIISSYIIYPILPTISSHSPLWLISIIIVYKHIPNIVKLFKKEEKHIM